MTFPRFSTKVLEFTPGDERVASPRLRIGEMVLTVVCAYGPNSGSEYPPFLQSLEKVLEDALLGTLLSYWDTSTHIWAMTARPGGSVIGGMDCPI